MEWYENSNLVLAIVVENMALLVITMGCFLVYVKKNKTRKSNEEYELMDMLNRYYSQSADNVKKSYDQINVLKHDIRNLLLVVMNLISENQPEEAKNLLGEKLHQIDRIYKLVDTDNEYANAILNQKLSEARAADMEMHCAVLTSFGGIGNQDICSYKCLKLNHNQLPLTGKASGEHGYGSRIVQEIARKYRGEVLYRVGEKEVEVAVHLRRSPAGGA